MTQYELTIERAAREAYESSMDAFGHTVPCITAWKVIREMWQDRGDFELPYSMPRLFAECYMDLIRLVPQRNQEVF